MRKILLFIAGVSTLAGIYFLFYGFQVYKETAEIHDILNLSYLGQFLSGIVVSLFTLATILLILLAYINQRDEIKHLQEMNDKQDDVIKAQIKKDEYEKFERTYYRLLDWYNSFRNSISYTDVHFNRTYVGRGALNKVIEDFKRLMTVKLVGKVGIQVAIDESFEWMFNNHDDMQPYFNNLYSVLDFIDSYFLAEVIEEDEANKFMFVLSGQLARAETELLFYYGLYSKGPGNIKQIIENYGLLKNINKKNLTEEEIKSYRDSAYI